jgi:hypothetical protein
MTSTIPSHATIVRFLYVYAVGSIDHSAAIIATRLAA